MFDNKELFRCIETSLQWNNHIYWDRLIRKENIHKDSAEASIRSLKFIFEDLQAHIVIIITQDTNEKNWKLAERLGFPKEAHFRESRINNEKRWGMLYYGMLKDEYRTTFKDECIMDTKIFNELSEELENMGQDTRSAEVWYALGGELYNAGHIVEAETAFRQAINLNPSDALAWCDLGGTLFLQNKFDEAESAFKGALEHNEEDTHVWYNLGCVYNVTDRLDDAAIAFRRAIELAPENVDAWVNLGVVLSTSGEIKEAEKVLRKSIEMRPEHFVGWLNLISLLYREGRSKEAEELHQNALEIIPDFDDFADDIKEYVENVEGSQ